MGEARKIKINPKSNNTRIKILPKKKNSKKSIVLKVLKTNLRMILGLAIVITLLSIWFALPQDETTDLKKIVETESSKKFFIPEINIENYKHRYQVISKDKSIREFLEEYNYTSYSILEIEKEAKANGLEIVKEGHEVHHLIPNNDLNTKIIVYEVSKYFYAVINESTIPNISIYRLPTEKNIYINEVVVKNDLWRAFEESQVPLALLSQVEEALKWSIDLFHLSPGDKFRLIYEQESVGEKVINTGQLLGVFFQGTDTEQIAIKYENNSKSEFYDSYGKPLKRFFLKSPVKYGRISSHYNLKRLHPVLGTHKPHLGTDYAAQKGTPVIAVGKGIIEKMNFTKNNGNFVKIKHNNLYSTQYLHLDGFVTNLRRGSKVEQGDIIGFVGETGLATGPHVCFRFWKKGKQVDHLKEDNVLYNESERLIERNFIQKRDSLVPILLNIEDKESMLQ